MGWLRFYFFVALIVSGFCFASDKAVGVEGAALDTTSGGGQKWALVVGINDYSNVPALDFARQDAVALRGSLIKAGFPADNIMLMTDTASGAMYPTRGNLRARINNISMLVDENDVLLIFFSGHGTQKNGQGYLVPVDGSTNDIGSLVPLSWVKSTVETSSAKHRLLILDACHSGAKAGDAADSPAEALLADLGGAAFATLSSCDAEQVSYEDDETGHGVFTSAIIEGLGGAADKAAQGNNDNVVNATELWAYSALKTKQWSAREGKMQTPVLRGNFKGLIEIARFKSLEAMKAQKEKLRKKLEAMEELNRTSAAEELKKEIAKLEAQLSGIGGGVGDIAGSDEVQIAYARYDAAKSQFDELKALLAEKTKVYQPTSSAIGKIKERIATAEAELATTLEAKYQADAIMYEVMQAQIDAKQGQYDELTKELRPGAPQARKLKSEIEQAIANQQTYRFGYYRLNASPGDVVTNSIGMKLVWVPAGEFIMGSEDGQDDEKPVHKVKISKGFWMGQFEVTQGQYEAIMGSAPWKGEDDARPDSSNAASYVSWNDAVEFCKRLSEKDGRTYTLPTEAQWEYACRAGTDTVYSFGDGVSKLGDYAWYDGNADSKGESYAHVVGQKKPNAYGLYDIHGNVWEWCRDYYDEDYYGTTSSVDPTSLQKSSCRVIRGGSWYNFANDCRVADRSYDKPGNRLDVIGFRVCLEVD